MFGGAALLLALAIGVLELRLAIRGYAPTMLDSPDLWGRQRARAVDLGERALILVGTSRMQTDIDLEVLREQTGLEPVQLAIDGSSFVPVLAGLAADDAVRGTIVVDYSDAALVSASAEGRAREWQATYERSRRQPTSPFEHAERRLSDAWRQRLRSYADAARPLDSLVRRIATATPVPQYVVIRADRSRLVDFAKFDLREAYYYRVARNLGAEALIVRGKPYAELDRELRERIDALAPAPDAAATHAAGTSRVAQQAATVRARGGSVRFVRLPSSGLVREIEERRFPRAQFWERFAADVGAPTLHFADVPAWRDLDCPDGSHLDTRQRAEFTRVLVEALGLARGP